MASIMAATMRNYEVRFHYFGTLGILKMIIPARSQNDAITKVCNATYGANTIITKVTVINNLTLLQGCINEKTFKI